MNNVILPINAEREDLSTHVDLCAQRYAELNQRLTNLEQKVDGLGLKIDGFRSAIVTTAITTVGSVLIALIGTVALILNHVK
jgi:hypothetical protein